MPCQNLGNTELVDRLVEVTLELDEIRSIAGEVHKRLGRDLRQAEGVDRSVSKEYLIQIAKRRELDRRHVHYSEEVARRDLHDDLVKAVQEARRTKNS